MGWEKKEFKIELPTTLKTVLDTTVEAMGTMNNLLGSIKALATMVQWLVTGVANPLLVALQFILGEIITVVRAFRNSGVHIIAINASSKVGYEVKIRDIWPQAEILETLDSLKFAQELREVEVTASSARQRMVEEFKKGKNRDKVLFKQLVVNLKDAEKAVREKKRAISLIRSQRNKLGQKGIWLMTADQAINAYLKSFTDRGDVNRPLYDEQNGVMLPEDQMILGGLVLLVGCTGDVDGFLSQYTKIVKLLAELLNIGEFYNEYHKFLKLSYDENETPSLSDKMANSVKPDWTKKILYSEIMPEFGTVLNSVENWLVGFQSSVVTPENDFQSALDYLDKKIKKIDETVKQINDFMEWFETIKESADGISSINFYSLYVPPSKNGITELKRLAASTSDPNSPLFSDLDSNQQVSHCSLLSVVGTGPAMSMIAAILGYSVDFLEGLGVDDTLTIDSRVMKEKFGLDTTYYD